MICFYHSDMDGKCSAAIVKKKMKDLNLYEDGKYIAMGYNKPFPFDEIEKDEEIIIVDFSLQKEGEFEKLLEITRNVIWIDHHKTAIEKHGNLEIEGLRRDGTAGCELTWEHFYPDMVAPNIVCLIGDYDVWTFNYGEKTKQLQSGIKLYNTSPTNDNWNSWLDHDFDLNPILEKGKTIIQYQANVNESTVKCSGYFTEFEGYKAVCCNGGGIGGSLLFDSVEEDFDIMINYWHDGAQWSVSMYTTKDIDCSVIAKKYGGGGHKQACGFTCKELPFGKDE